jgi:tetratricopeptide (TPR) repeat protein
VANALEARALVFLKLGQLDKAIADYDAALKTNPKLAGPLYGRGMAKLRTGDLAGGDADTAAAKEINPRIADSFAAYNVPTVRAETAPPAVETPVATSSTKPEPVAPAAEITTSPPPAIEAPVAMSSTRPEPIAPAAEAPGNRVAPAEPPPAGEITTS